MAVQIDQRVVSAHGLGCAAPAHRNELMKIPRAGGCLLGEIRAEMVLGRDGNARQGMAFEPGNIDEVCSPR